ncbi:hypothetical protein NN561_008942 [Cricetulus griseus]
MLHQQGLRRSKVLNVTHAASAGPQMEHGDERDPCCISRASCNQVLHVVSLLQNLQHKTPTHLAQQQEPWNRLSSTPTVNSMRRDAYFFDHKIPKDDLDFRLTALYDHHTEAFKNKTEILLHQETIQDIQGSKIQFPGEYLHCPPAPVTSQANIRYWINPKKESIYSIQGSIVSPHTAATNGGYSRKNDGGFFST